MKQTDFIFVYSGLRVPARRCLGRRVGCIGAHPPSMLSHIWWVGKRIFGWFDGWPSMPASSGEEGKGAEARGEGRECLGGWHVPIKQQQPRGHRLSEQTLGHSHLGICSGWCILPCVRLGSAAGVKRRAQTEFPHCTDVALVRSIWIWHPEGTAILVYRLSASGRRMHACRARGRSVLGRYILSSCKAK